MHSRAAPSLSVWILDQQWEEEVGSEEGAVGLCGRMQGSQKDRGQGEIDRWRKLKEMQFVQGRKM